ncbi:MAG TPA: hypothetical protein VFQ85_07340, partial [Mycobacteriales bacterium]|nr:hypothetical protein [Mycobacteriales bacterium]
MAGAAGTTIAGTTWVPVAPRRVLDTRTSLGGVGHAAGPGATIHFPVAGTAGVPATGVTAVAVTLTAVAPTATGGLVAHPWGSARPAVASLSFTARQNTTTLVVVRPGTGNHAAVYNSAGTTHVVADLIGYYATAGTTTAGTTWVPVAPRRVLDTRTSLGGVGHAAGPGATIHFPVAGTAGVPATGVTAVAVTLTAVAPTAT